MGREARFGASGIVADVCRAGKRDLIRDDCHVTGGGGRTGKRNRGCREIQSSSQRDIGAVSDRCTIGGCERNRSVLKKQDALICSGRWCCECGNSGAAENSGSISG